MNRLLIQPNTVENRILIFFTTPKKLVSNTALGAKIKKIVLEILYWIVNVLTLGIIAGYCADKRWVLESKMQNDMIKQLPDLIKEAVTIAMTTFMNTISPEVDCFDVIECVENVLKEVDGLSDNVREYILSLIPIERLIIYAEKKLSESEINHPLTSYEIQRYVKTLVEEVQKEVIYGRTSLDKIRHLCPKTAREKEELYIFVHMSANFHKIESDYTERQPILKKPDHIFVTIENPVDQIKEVLDCFWFEFHSARPEGRDGIKQDYLAILPQIEGVSEKRAASLIDFITAAGEVHRQVIVNNFEFLPEESL